MGPSDILCTFLACLGISVGKNTIQYLPCPFWVMTYTRIHLHAPPNPTCNWWSDHEWWLKIDYKLGTPVWISPSSTLCWCRDRWACPPVGYCWPHTSMTGQVEFTYLDLDHQASCLSVWTGPFPQVSGTLAICSTQSDSLPQVTGSSQVASQRTPGSVLPTFDESTEPTSQQSPPASTCSIGEEPSSGTQQPPVSTSSISRRLMIYFNQSNWWILPRL